MKTCSRCGQTKELDGFSKRSNRPSGVQSNVRIVKEKFVGNTIKPTNMPDADLNLQKTNIMI